MTNNKTCDTCYHISLWNDRGCNQNPDLYEHCKKHGLQLWKQGKEPLENPGEVFKDKIKPEDYHIDWETRRIYVADLYGLGQKMGKNWSRMAEMVEWCGWLIVGGGKA